MKLITYLVLSTVLLLNLSCKKKADISIEKISRLENGNEIDIFFKNNTKVNYYILGLQCGIDNSNYFRAGFLDSSNFKNYSVIDSTVKRVYNFVDLVSTGKENAIPIVFFKSKSTTKLTFKFKEDIEKYPKTNVILPFNVAHKQLDLLKVKLENIKLDSTYNFFSKEIPDLSY